MSDQDYITLKWGTLKSWHLTSEECQKLMQSYLELGVSMSAIAQHDTPEQKALVFQIIDACNAPTVYLEWNDKEVSKEEAKQYVMEYGQRHIIKYGDTRREM